jgi:hypothetical protein
MVRVTVAVPFAGTVTVFALSEKATPALAIRDSYATA